MKVGGGTEEDEEEWIQPSQLALVKKDVNTGQLTLSSGMLLEVHSSFFANCKSVKTNSDVVITYHETEAPGLVQRKSAMLEG